MIKRRPLAVVALGGNALVAQGESPSASGQEAVVTAAARSLALLSRTHRLVVTNGNGPQVGGPVPGPETLIGYRLDGHLARIVGSSRVVTLLTQVLVDRDDPAFAGVHPSPVPLQIVELETIRLLVEAGLIVVCGGGGGIPVVRTTGGLGWIDAMIDRDAAAALMAFGLQADLLVLLTDVAGVYQDWATDDARLITSTTPAQLADRRFAAGSMAPKVAAACRFVESTGRPAVIGAISDAAAVVAGAAGTWVLPDEPMDGRAA